MKIKSLYKNPGLILAGIVMAISFLASACQKTPEELVVQNKADDDLKEAIAVTAEPASKAPQATPTPEQITRVEQSSSNEAGTVAVSFDAEVILPGISKIPVARIGPAEFTQGQVDKIIKTFFGDVTFYDPNVTTKTEIENTIVRLRKSATDLNSDLAQSNGIDNLEDLRKAADEWIASLEKQWQNAPGEHPVIETSCIAQSEQFFAKAYIEGMEDLAYLYYTDRAPFRYIHCVAFGGHFDAQVRKLECYSSTPVDLDSGDEQYARAKQLAENLVAEMGIEGISLGGAYLSMDNMGIIADGTEQKAPGVLGDREYYVFCYERIVGEGTLDKTFYQGTRPEDEFAEPWPYEKIEVWVEGGKIVQFVWNSPAGIKEMVNENARMQIDYTAAAELAAQHALLKYAGSWPDLIKDSVVEIDKVEFALIRIRERNSDSFLVVPAWKFFGEAKAHLTQEALDSPFYSDSTDYVPLSGWLTPMDSRNLITINALDGTVIDMELGY